MFKIYMLQSLGCDIWVMFDHRGRYITVFTCWAAHTMTRLWHIKSVQCSFKDNTCDVCTVMIYSVFCLHKAFHAVFSYRASDRLKSITPTVKMLLEYYPRSARREMACQVASLAALQEKQKQETADQCVNLEKQWIDLETGRRRWSGTAQQIRWCQGGTNKLGQPCGTAVLSGLWSKHTLLLQTLLLVCFLVVFLMCSDAMCVFAAGALRVFCRGLRGRPRVHWHPAVPHTRHPG